MSSYRKKVPPLDILQKRVPVNARYKDVRSTIDTGASISKYLEKIEDIKQNYKFSKDEIFKRMKITTFVQLLVQVFKLMSMNAGEDVQPMTPDGRDELYSNASNSARESVILEEDGDGDGVVSGRSTLLSVAQGMGEMDMNNKTSNNTNFYTHNPRSSSYNDNNNYSNNNNSNTNTPNTPNNNNNKHLLIQGDNYYTNDTFSPYLLLDIRSKEDYNTCHITTALSYPKAILSRSVNYESSEMLAFKNRAGKIIVVYDEDEKEAIVVAITLVQRGYDNIFMMSGGLKVALRTFPQGLVTGKPPSHLSIKAYNNRSNKVSNSIDNMLLNNNQHNNGNNGINNKSSGAVTTKSTRVNSRINNINNRGVNSKEEYNYTEKPNNIDMNRINQSLNNLNEAHFNNKHNYSTNSLNNSSGNNNNNDDITNSNNNQLRQNDVDSLEIYLQNHLSKNDASSRISSRLSTVSNNSKLSSRSGRSTKSTLPPFKI